MRISPSVFARIGLTMVGAEDLTREATIKRHWRANFGASPVVCSNMWELIDPTNNANLPSNAQVQHLLWALCLLKLYKAEEAYRKMTNGVDATTFRKWSWLFVDEIAFLEARVILWENRRIDDILNDAMCSVDGTDTILPNFKPRWKGWYSYKLNHGGSRWEVGLCIRTGEIVWIHGPFPAGRWNDIKIFRHAMKYHLDDHEKAEADDGYVGEPMKCLTPKLSSHWR